MFNQHEAQKVQANPKDQPRKPEKYLRLPDVESLTGLKKSSIYAGMKLGTFPPCLRVSARAVAWPENSIANWQATRVQAASAASGDGAK